MSAFPRKAKRKYLIAYYFIYYHVRILGKKLKWSPWSPWSVAMLNLAWSKYIETPMYEGRKELEKEGPKFKNFAQIAFADDITFFVSKFTKKDWLKVIFLPFSCGDVFRIPFWKLLSDTEE